MSGLAFILLNLKIPNDNDNRKSPRKMSSNYTIDRPFDSLRAKIRFWLDAHLRSKWCWAGHVLRMNGDRLAHRSMVWTDSAWQAQEDEVPASLRIRRPRRTRWFRWEDELKRYSASRGWSSWHDVARRQDVAGKASDWLSDCNSFVKFSKK